MKSTAQILGDAIEQKSEARLAQEAQAQKDQEEAQLDLALRHQEWLNHPLTQQLLKGLVYPRLIRLEAVEALAGSNNSETVDKITTKLVEARILGKVINYVRTNQPVE